MAKGVLAIRMPEEAQNLAFLLGCLFPCPERAVPGLYQLLQNGIEHGNLGIGFAPKGRLLAKGTWEAAVRQRLAVPEMAKKKVEVQFAPAGSR